MALRLFNTKSRAVEPFETLKPGLVRMYVCGPTVYAPAHLGHGRSYVAYDVMRRYFVAKGFEVEHVQNFTDIEESVARAAREAGVPPLKLADDHILAYLRDMDALRVLRADHYPRVSENVTEIKRIVSDLLEAGHAYRVDCQPGTRAGADSDVCDVYFDVASWPRFGELVGQSPDELIVDDASERGDRRHPLDFALWKSRDDWGVTWPSEWGDGRPGWHVECTAMALKYLGNGFDLHGGGLDLVFPHHECEQAVGEAWTGHAYCGFFVHNGFVTIGSRKMSKSKGNYVTLEDLLARADPELVRLFLLSAHYRAPLDYEEAALAACTERLARWRRAVASLREAARGAPAAHAPAVDGPVGEARKAFWAALEDDFRTDLALDAVDDVVARAAGTSGRDAASALAVLKEAADVLGILWDVESRWVPKPLPTMPAR